MDVYIKPVEKAEVVGRQLVYLKDIAEVEASNQYIEGLKTLVVLRIKGKKKSSYLISVIDVIREIKKLIPSASIVNVGEADVVVEYKPKPEKTNPFWLYTKVGFVFLVLLAGACTTIMSFHTDGQIPKIFENYYQIFFGEYMQTPAILTIPYSIGLGVGIMVFFNHFSKIYITKDPTPIEVEMTTYEKEVVSSMLDALNRRKEEGSGES